MSAALARSDRDRVIAGVCGGIAERTGLSSSAVRLAFVLSCLLPGPQFLIYLVLWRILPSAKTAQAIGQGTGFAPPAGPAQFRPTTPAPDRAAMPTVSDVTAQTHPAPQPWTGDARPNSFDPTAAPERRDTSF